ncbi:peptidylprolyl isomerase [Pseudoalteromonas sp.]|uniref:peptidylprolyl isomerase n=1 Tax=Pseudoalteromonas sp. TaxID=53249 RepID=UPI00257EE672|nr:peptidylprolyl isomerase [Pseudoalteromonas sp.]
MTALLGLLFSNLAVAAFNQYTESEIDLMWQVYKEQSHDISKQLTRERLYENQFLLKYAQKNMPELVERQARVGFSTHYHVMRYLDNLFIHQLNLTGKPATTGLEPFDKHWLKTNLGLYPLDGQYSDAQIKQFNDIKLDLFENSMTLYEFIAPLSMQTRFRLHQGDSELFKTEVLKHRQFLLHLKQADAVIQTQQISIPHLYSIAKGDILRPSIQSWLGVKGIMHVESPVLTRLENKVTDAEIQQYYQQHKERFHYLKSVKAHGGEFTDREAALAFKKQAETSSIQHALKQLNQPDIYAQYNNYLTREHKRNWAVQLAFTQKPQQLSEVIRSPNGLWVVVMSYDHAFGYFDENDETVRYQAKKVIAVEKAIINYQQSWLAWQKAHGIKL